MPRKKKADNTKQMFKDPSGQVDFIQKSLEEELEAKRNQPVECLGIKFPNDAARREHFLGELAKKLKDPEFRKIEGFPIGEDEDILALSDPPYYTACPNPWIADFIAEWESQKPKQPEGYHYHREPFAADVSEGKNDPIYNAHSYHTKVPHKAIMRYILHYTEPGDIVFDGFCGTGMTGVAAQLCGDRDTVVSLGYQVKPDGAILQEETDANGKKTWTPFSKLGARHTVLNDLSPAATFIAYNQNTPTDAQQLLSTSKAILAASETDLGHLYRLTSTTDARDLIYHMIWSEVLLCGNCSREVDFWTGGVDKKTKRIMDNVTCPHCGSVQGKRDMRRVQQSVFDPSRNAVVQVAKYIPVAVETLSDRTERELSQQEITEAIALDTLAIRTWFPSLTIERDIDLWYERDYRSLGLLSLDRFYTRRNLAILADVWNRALAIKELRIKSGILFSLTAMVVNLSRMNRWRPGVSFPYNPLSGTLYIPSLSVESNVYVGIANKIKRLTNIWRNNPLQGQQAIATQSSTSLSHIPANSLNYVFIDPPFGSNIIYSDLSILHEGWLRLGTNTQQEAVVHRRKKKDAVSLDGYRKLIASSLGEVYRCLKPGRWVTIEFSNTRASVWNAIQAALQEAGFIIANVAALDKQQGSFKAVTTPTAVKQDLVISAYKPNGGFEERFKQEAETEAGVWDFVRTHMKYLPVTKQQGGVVQAVPERDPRILFDQMVAYYVRKGYPVPLSSPEFQAGLAQRFIPRDGMFFLPDQAAAYDMFSASHGRPAQMSLFVSDEASAIDWLRNLLGNKPQTSADINPQFMKELGGWSKHEKPLDLRELLNQNFLCFDGKGDIPSQIHSYLSSNWPELRNLPKNDTALTAKAKDRWYVPDPNKTGDLEKLRERALLREFWEYLPEGHKPQVKLDTSGELPGLVVPQPKIPTGKRMRIIRTEAVRVGFKYCWQNRDYRTIVVVAKRIPEDVLQEDPKLLMWYDQALTRLGEE